MQTSLSLPGELTIYTVSDLQPQWLAWLVFDAKDDALSVDASAVSEVDGAGLQLLVSLSRALSGRQRVLHLLNPSAPLLAACTALGLASLCATPERAEGAAA